MFYNELKLEYDASAEATKIINLVINYINSKKEYDEASSELESLKEELKRKQEFLDDVIHGRKKWFIYGYNYKNEDNTLRYLNYRIRTERRIKEINELINKYESNESTARRNYRFNRDYLNDYLYSLGKDMLVKIIKHLNINIELEEDEYDLRNKIRNSVIEDIELIISNELDISLAENYKGIITFINALINKKNTYESILKEIDSCIKEIDEIDDKKDNFESTIREAKNKREIYKANPLKKIIYSYNISKLTELIDETKRIQGYMLVNRLGFVEELKILKEHLITEHKDYMKIYNVLEVILDKMDKEQLKDICNKLNIVITMPDTLYFDLEKEMKKEIIKYFEIQNAESIINNKKQQKILTKQV